MSTFIRAILATALLVSAPAFAEEAHHAPAQGAGTAATDTAAQPDMKGSMSSGGAAGMMSPDMMKQMMGMHAEMMRGMTSSGGMAMSQGAAMRQMMSPEHVEGRIAFLRTELKISAAQQPLWDAVADALRAGTSSGMTSVMPEGMMQSDASPKALPQKLSEMERLLSSRLDGLRRLNTALVPFYESLDESQKVVADDLLMPMGMM